MKTKLLFSLLMLSASVLIFSCYKEDDHTKPVITLKGLNPVIISLGSTYKDSGAVAIDNKDGNISAGIIVDNFVNENLKGAYTVNYTVYDAAGNIGTASRTVLVINDADPLAANYFVTDNVTGVHTGTFNYGVNVYSSTTVNNKFFINNFGGFGTSVSVYCFLSGTTIIIPTQSPANMLNPGSIVGTGTTSNDSIVNITYTVTYSGGSTDNGFAVYTKL